VKLRIALKVIGQSSAWLHRKGSYRRAVARVHQSWRTEDRRFRRERIARENAGEKRPECDNCDGSGKFGGKECEDCGGSGKVKMDQLTEISVKFINIILNQLIQLSDKPLLKQLKKIQLLEVLVKFINIINNQQIQPLDKPLIIMIIMDQHILRLKIYVLDQTQMR
jgi:hypothetical protein